jgi:hypothetical protein
LSFLSVMQVPDRLHVNLLMSYPSLAAANEKDESRDLQD